MALFVFLKICHLRSSRYWITFTCKTLAGVLSADIRYHRTANATYFYSNLFFYSFRHSNGRSLFGECSAKWFRCVVHHCCRYILHNNAACCCAMPCAMLWCRCRHFWWQCFIRLNTFEIATTPNRFFECIVIQTYKQTIGKRTMYKFVLNDVLLPSRFSFFRSAHPYTKRPTLYTSILHYSLIALSLSPFLFVFCKIKWMCKKGPKQNTTEKE